MSSIPARAGRRSLVAGSRKIAAVSVAVAIADVATGINRRVIGASMGARPSQGMHAVPPCSGIPTKPSSPPIERVQGPDIKGCTRGHGSINTRAGDAVNDNMTISVRELSLEDQ